METKENNAVALKKVSVSYTIEEAVMITRVFDDMLNNVAYDVHRNEVPKELLEDALTANLLIKQLRDKVYSAALGEI